VATATGVSEEGGARYLQVARELKRAISDGRYPVGSRLPTELELCESFGISRFTAAAAIRVLSSAGLITRRRRIGTEVIATPDETRYTQDMGSVRDLQQYATDTELQLVYIGRVALSRAQARDFGAEAGQEWVFALGVRRGGEKRDQPICVTRLFLNPGLQGIETRLRKRKSAVYAMIESEYGAVIERVEQDLTGVVLDADDAANLECLPGAPALKIVRRYYADDGRLLEVAENVHPSDRFTYHLQLRR
jgi:DNA-binding GntR family transcriptional regulator